MKLLPLILALTSSLLVLQPTLAWNDFGHEAVASVCYQRLTPQVKERAKALIKLNPQYGEWLKHVCPAFDEDEQLFMIAATWSDQIKDRSDYINDPAGPDSTQNIGYSDKRMHKYWHYVDIPYSQDGTPLPPLPLPTAEDEIPAFQRVLASDANDELKSYDLCWLLHIVGDIHQPLHTINRACKDSPRGDNGANDVKITGSADKALHKFWDNLLGPEGPPATVIPFAHKLSSANKELAAETNVHDWVQESHQLAIDKFYQKPIGPEDGPYALTKEYKKMASKLAKQRVELAGERLANLLNQSLK